MGASPKIAPDSQGFAARHTAPVRLFISYASHDREICEALKRHLTPLRDRRVIEEWWDREIPIGGDWNGEIHRKVDDCHIILLVVSPYFLESTYIWSDEVARARERHDKGQVRIFQVRVRYVLDQDLPFPQCQCLPRDGGTICQSPDPDKALADIRAEIEKTIRHEKGRPERPPNPFHPLPGRFGLFAKKMLIVIELAIATLIADGFFRLTLGRPLGLESDAGFDWPTRLSLFGVLCVCWLVIELTAYANKEHQ
jgi:hypothetical protein